MLLLVLEANSRAKEEPLNLERTVAKAVVAEL